MNLVGMLRIIIVVVPGGRTRGGRSARGEIKTDEIISGRTEKVGTIVTAGGRGGMEVDKIDGADKNRGRVVTSVPGIRM